MWALVGSCCSQDAASRFKGRIGSVGEVTVDQMQSTGTDGSRSSHRRHETRKGNKDRIQARETSDDLPEEEHFMQHRKHKSIDGATLQAIKDTLKQDRICGLLDGPEIDAIAASMEYFEFAADSLVVTQGEAASRFVVIQDGTMEVSVNGSVRNTLPKGTSFGGISLLYNCPRTASVKACTNVALWGASGATFQKVLKENAQKHFADNRKLIDSIKLLQGLNSKQKDYVCEAFFTEVFEVGARVVTEGDAAPTMHLVKSGQLSVVQGGTVKQTGELVGGNKVRELVPGDCFGERAILQNEPRTATVIATSKSEVLCVSGADLQDALGTDLASCLERNFIFFAMRKSPVFLQFTSAQHSQVANAMETKVYPPKAAIERAEQKLCFVVVLDGVLLTNQGGQQQSLARGQFYEDGFGSEDIPAQAVAGPEGAKLAVLTKQGLANVFKDMGLSQGGSAQEATDSAQKMALVRKVYVFRHLGEQQVVHIINALKMQKYKKGDQIIKQGEVGDTFFVIHRGEVTVKKDGAVLRTMAKNGYFGERALLMDEPRTASVEVSSNEVEVWYIEKATFEQILNPEAKKELVKRIELQDTKVGMKELRQIKVVGCGATGVVRLVEHKKSRIRYALKRVKKERNGKIPEEVKRECELLLENDHPFIMKLVTTFDTPKGVYMLTELITGGELHGAIRQIPTVLSRPQAQFYTGSLLIVLEELADRQIVYRDLKPENVMLDSQGYLKLIDFGIAKKLDEDKNRTFTMVGTPHYMAPEVMRGQGYGCLVDIWSLGVIQFEFVCGYLPFADDLDDPSEVCHAVLKSALAFPHRYRDANGRALMQGLLCRQPKKRMGSGAQGYDEIRKAPYFQENEKTSIFDKIMARELVPPLVPKGETYCSEEDARVRLSDGELLG